MTIKNKFIFPLLLIGLALISLNVIGLFIDLRNEDIYNEEFNTKHGSNLTEEEFYSELEKVFDNSNHSDSTKIVSTTSLVNNGLAHYWYDNGINKYNLTVPIYENYLLFLMRYVYPSKYKKYEFLDWHKAIERGVGLCSQHAVIESEILKENGINSRMIGLAGHVVAMAEYEPDKWMVVDPDYGVNIPYHLNAIENDVELIEKYYADEGHDSTLIVKLKKIYNKEGNSIIENVDAYKGKSGLLEPITYWLIWIIPIILCVPYFRRKFFN